MVFDTHCHLTADAFEGDLEEVLGRARAAGLVGMTCIASTPADADGAIGLAESNADIWATAGVHPHEAGSAEPGWDAEVEARLRHPRVVAVGECGLDFHYDFAPRDRQFDVFARQIELAAAHDLPLVVHSRTADREMQSFLSEMPTGVRGVLHCFSGGDELLDTALGRGWYVSFGGMVTFRKWTDEERLRRVPVDRLLVETDSPYLAPVPFRGKRNEPAHVVRVVERIAELRGEDPIETARRTTRNALEFYRIETAGD